MREITATELTSFDRDGVVHLRAAIDDRWIQPMIDAADRVVADPTDGQSPELKAAGLARRIYASDDQFREFVFESGLAALAAQATRS